MRSAYIRCLLGVSRRSEIDAAVARRRGGCLVWTLSEEGQEDSDTSGPLDIILTALCCTRCKMTSSGVSKYECELVHWQWGLCDEKDGIGEWGADEEVRVWGGNYSSFSRQLQRKRQARLPCPTTHHTFLIRLRWPLCGGRGRNFLVWIKILTSEYVCGRAPQNQLSKVIYEMRQKPPNLSKRMI